MTAASGASTKLPAQALAHRYPDAISGGAASADQGAVGASRFR